MYKTQDPKYDIEIYATGTGSFGARLVSRDSGPIPEDEPIFILRAKDHNAVHALEDYKGICKITDHKAAVELRCRDFDVYALNNPDKMKEPDTDLSKL